MLTREQFLMKLYKTDDSQVSCKIYNGLIENLMLKIAHHFNGGALLPSNGDVLCICEYCDKWWKLTLNLIPSTENVGYFGTAEGIEILESVDSTAKVLAYREVTLSNEESENLEITIDLQKLTYNYCLRDNDLTWRERMILLREEIAYQCYLTLCSLGNVDYLDI